MATESVDEVYLILDKMEPTDEGVKEARAALQAYFTRESAKLEKAYGGCHNCYGKGYATGADLWGGVDTDQDIGSPGGRVSGGNPNAMKFCTCDRGKQLRERWASYTRECARKVLEARIDEAYLCLKNVPMPSLSYEQVEQRIAELRAAIKGTLPQQPKPLEERKDGDASS